MPPKGQRGRLWTLMELGGVWWDEQLPLNQLTDKKSPRRQLWLPWQDRRWHREDEEQDEILEGGAEPKPKL